MQLTPAWKTTSMVPTDSVLWCRSSAHESSCGTGWHISTSKLLTPTHPRLRTIPYVCLKTLLAEGDAIFKDDFIVNVVRGGNRQVHKTWSLEQKRHPNCCYWTSRRATAPYSLSSEVAVHTPRMGHAVIFPSAMVFVKHAA